jgi:hypothetical protein
MFEEKREAVLAIEAAVLPLMQCGINGNAVTFQGEYPPPRLGG